MSFSALFKVFAVFACISLFAACASKEPASILEQDVRVPDDEGVVTEVTLDRLVLDNDRIYEVSKEVESFLASSRKPAALASTDHRYVQIGLSSNKRVVWISTVGVVAKTDPPMALYSGHFLRRDSEGRAVFKDGTVLKVRSGVGLPKTSKQVAVRVDPSAKEIVEFLGS